MTKKSKIINYFLFNRSYMRHEMNRTQKKYLNVGSNKINEV